METPYDVITELQDEFGPNMISVGPRELPYPPSKRPAPQYRQEVIRPEWLVEEPPTADLLENQAYPAATYFFRNHPTAAQQLASEKLDSVVFGYNQRFPDFAVNPSTMSQEEIFSFLEDQSSNYSARRWRALSTQDFTGFTDGEVWELMPWGGDVHLQWFDFYDYLTNTPRDIPIEEVVNELPTEGISINIGNLYNYDLSRPRFFKGGLVTQTKQLFGDLV